MQPLSGRVLVPGAYLCERLCLRHVGEPCWRACIGLQGAAGPPAGDAAPRRGSPAPDQAQQRGLVRQRKQRGPEQRGGRQRERRQHPRVAIACSSIHAHSAVTALPLLSMWATLPICHADQVTPCATPGLAQPPEHLTCSVTLMGKGRPLHHSSLCILTAASPAASVRQHSSQVRQALQPDQATHPPPTSARSMPGSPRPPATRGRPRCGAAPAPEAAARPARAAFPPPRAAPR